MILYTFTFALGFIFTIFSQQERPIETIRLLKKCSFRVDIVTLSARSSALSLWVLLFTIVTSTVLFFTLLPLVWVALAGSNGVLTPTVRTLHRQLACKTYTTLANTVSKDVQSSPANIAALIQSVSHRAEFDDPTLTKCFRQRLSSFHSML